MPNRTNRSLRKRVRHTLEELPPEGSERRRLFHENARVSPLLRLPPELRIQIYGLLLRVGQIAIFFRKWDRRMGVYPGFYCRTLTAGQDPWKWFLNGGGQTVIGTVTVTLLSGVCRQLYHDTALLPYKLNAWSFGARSLLNRFLSEERLSRRQRQAIHTLYVPEKLSGAEERQFAGLRVVGWRDRVELKLRTRMVIPCK